MRSPLLKTVRWLRRRFPARKPCRISVCRSLPGMHGVCLIHEDRALIKIAKSTEQMMDETLLEEWAHLLRDECPIPYHEGQEHDALFWAILAAVTKEYRGD
jgi:hypothetical protein